MLMLMLCSVLSLGIAPPSTQSGIHGTRQLALDTYAYVDESGSNCGFVLSPEGVVVIDTGGSSAYARNLLAAVRGVTSERVRYVINTHYDYESTFGNCIVGKAATILAHPNCKTTLQAKGERMLHDMRAAGQPGLQDITIKLPIRLVWRSRDLSLFGRKIMLVPFVASHSPGDLCVWLPEEKVLFSGDLVFSNQMPDLKDADVENWGRALNDLAALGPETIVPAHGVLCDASAIETTKGFLQALTSKVKAAINSRMSKEEAVEKVDMSEFSDLAGYRELVGVAIERAYDELD